MLSFYRFKMRGSILLLATIFIFVGYISADTLSTKSSILPVCKGPGEVAVSCTKQCQPTCDTVTGAKTPEICVPDDKCTPGCDCLPGYFRNALKVCLKAESCLCPKANYQVVKCPNPCPGGTCETPEFQQCNVTCKEYGCQCKPGRVKDDKGYCILLETCPPKCEGRNEVSSPCTDLCPLTCKGITTNNTEHGCFPAPCVAGCNCASDFVRNVNGVCIKPGNCRCGDPNAEVVTCPNPCPGGTCDSPDFSICKVNCKTYGCQCKKGFVKNSEGKCVLLSQCPPVCKGLGEVAVSCTQQCQPTCDTITGAKAPETCVPDGKCTPGCDCLPGYFRNALKVCLEAESCLCPKANYRVVKCPNPCPGGTCETPEFQQCNATCKEYGCQCKPGRVMDEKGYCILLETCPPKCEGRNEVSSPCTDNCPLTCKGIISNNPEQQDCYPAPCVAGCNCASGFARNVNGVCVKPGNCRCGDPNAEVVKCPNACPGGTCEEPEKSSCKLLCKSYGCQCKKGFVKDSDGKCILLSQCVPICKGPDEIAVSCKNQCQPTCDSITSNTPQEICVPDSQCIPGCDCLPGYFRNGYNICIKAESCLCPAAYNQVVQCPNPCPGGTCDTPEFIDCDASCKEYGCQCKEGRVKDKQGNCVLLEYCPLKCEGKNEVSSLCRDFCPLTCKGIVSNKPEQQGCFPAPCVAGCNCAVGFARNVNDVCIQPENCRCGDSNAEVVQCPSPCLGGTCELPEFSACTELCAPYGCQCKKGSVKDSTGKCVLLSECRS